jgi:hypothetical protein
VVIAPPYEIVGTFMREVQGAGRRGSSLVEGRLCVVRISP